MRSLGGFLSRYTNLKAPESSIRGAFIKAVREVIEIDLPEDAVRVRNKTAHIEASSTIKSEIRLHQSEILQRVQDELGDPHCLTALY